MVRGFLTAGVERTVNAWSPPCALRCVQDPEQQRLAAFLLHHIRNDGSRVYGDGYRAALAAHSAMGLQAMLSNVRKHGRYSP